MQPDAACIGVLRNIGQALLRHAVQRDIQQFPQMFEVSLRCKLNGHCGEPAAPHFDMILERRRQPEFVQPRRTQLARHIAHHRVHVIGDAYDSLRAVTNNRRVAAGGITNRHRIDLDRVEMLAQLIVQLAGKIAALLLLHLHV